MMNSDIRDQWLATFGTDGILDKVTGVASTDVALTAGGTWYDGPSVALTAGMWLVTAGAQFRHATNTSYMAARLNDGTTVYLSSGEATISVAGNSVAVALPPVLKQMSSSGTITLQGVSASAAGSMLAACPNNAAGNNATQIAAVRIGPSS